MSTWGTIPVDETHTISQVAASAARNRPASSETRTRHANAEEYAWKYHDDWHYKIPFAKCSECAAIIHFMDVTVAIKL
jgi:hypothetical protein